MDSPREDTQMPHVIEVGHGPVQYPARCPYCEEREADRKIRRLFLRASTTENLPGAATDAKETVYLEYPACKACASSLFRGKWLALALLALPWLATAWLYWNDSHLLGRRTIEFALWGAAGLSLLGLIMMGLRQFRLGRFRVGRIGSTTTAYYSRSAAYAKDFAAANGTQSEFRLFDTTP